MLARGVVASRHEELREVAGSRRARPPGRAAPARGPGAIDPPCRFCDYGALCGVALREVGAMSVHVVSASAGTGKTYRLTGELAKALLDGTARPEGVVAITYTVKAAGELESRIRTDLIRAGRADLAARVRDGYLGTVHSVCQRLLREFALEAGLSPWLEPIAEAQRERLFDEALAPVLAGREGRIERIAGAFELEDWETGPLRSIVDPARENGLDGAALRDARRERSLAALLAVLPPVATTEDGIPGAARRRGARGRRASSTRSTRDGQGGARTDATPPRELVRALDRGPGFRLEGQFKAVRQKWTGRSCRLVARARGASSPSTSPARASTTTSRSCTRELFGVAGDALDAFAADEGRRRASSTSGTCSRSRAAAARATPASRTRLARARPRPRRRVPGHLAPAARGGVARSRGIARRSVWVGDRKQAIFGFQGSDPELMAAAIGHALGGRAPEFLAESWRSRPPLVAFTSELFVAALAPHGFPRAGADLDARRAPGPGGAGGRAGARVLAVGRERRAARAIADGVVAGSSRSRRPSASEATAARSGPPRAATWRSSRARTPLPQDRRGARARAASRQGSLAGSPRTPEASSSARRSRSSPIPRTASPRWRSRSSAARGAADPDGWLSARLVEAARDRAARERPEAAGERRPRPPSPSRTTRASRRCGRVHAARRGSSPAQALDPALAGRGSLELAPHLARPGAAARQPRGAPRRGARLRGALRVRRSAGDRAGLVEHLASLGEQKDARLQAVPGDRGRGDRQHLAQGEGARVAGGGPRLASTSRRSATPWSVRSSAAAALRSGRPLAGRWVRWWPWPYGKLGRASRSRDRGEHTPRGGSACARTRRASGSRLLYVGFTRARDLLVLAAAMKKGDAATAALEPLRGRRRPAAARAPVRRRRRASPRRVRRALELACRVRAVSGRRGRARPRAPRPAPWYDGAPAGRAAARRSRTRRRSR